MQFGRSVLLYLVPTVVQNALAIAVLPFSTRFLGPEEYGLFGLVTSFALIGGALASLGVGYVMPAHYQLLDRDQKKALVSTATWLGILVMLAFCGVCVGLWLVLGAWFPGVRGVSMQAISLTALAAILSAPWAVAHQVILLDRRPRMFASITLSQSGVWFFSLLAGLYVFDLGILALFYARLLGGVVQLAGAFALLRPLLTFHIERSWFRRLFGVGAATTAGNIMEQAQVSVSSLLLTAFAGVRSLGLYAHSLQYRSAAIMLTNGFANTMWPITLSEAREDDLQFTRTQLGWRAVHFLVAGLGLGAVVLGRPFLAWLTNDQFTAAAPLLPVWMILVLIQTSGRKANGLLYSGDEGVFLSIWNTLSIAAGIVLAVALVPGLGIAGAAIGLFLQHLCYRVGMQLRAHRNRRDLAFEDSAVLVHVAVVATAFVLCELLALGTMQRAVFASLGLAGLALLDRRSLSYAMVYARNSLRPTAQRASAR